MRAFPRAWRHAGWTHKEAGDDTPRAGRGLVTTMILVAGVGLGWWARATQGAASTGNMYFSGTLKGTTGPQTLTFVFKKAGAACAAPDVVVTPDSTTGAFNAGVNAGACPSTFFDGSDATYDIMLGASALVSNQPIGSVPYAKYADMAWRASSSITSNIARRTFGQVLYVRTTGNDANSMALSTWITPRPSPPRARSPRRKPRTTRFRKCSATPWC